MTGVHPDLGELGPELRRIARAILDGVDPTLRAVAAAAVAGDPGKCQQVWCPVCALAALAGGEQHPLLDVIAEHSVALLTVIRAMVDNSDATPEADAPAGAERARTGYQHIPVDVEE